MAEISLLSNPPLLSVSIFHYNSLKGGISKSTNGRDLIGKGYGEGGAVYCLQWWLKERHPLMEIEGLTLHNTLATDTDSLSEGELL